MTEQTQPKILSQKMPRNWLPRLHYAYFDLKKVIHSFTRGRHNHDYMQWQSAVYTLQCADQGFDITVWVRTRKPSYRRENRAMAL